MSLKNSLCPGQNWPDVMNVYTLNAVQLIYSFLLFVQYTYKGVYFCYILQIKHNVLKNVQRQENSFFEVNNIPPIFVFVFLRVY